MMRKKWTICFLAVIISVLLIIGTLMYLFDPYFHFHAPYAGVSYSVGNQVYQNDGIAANWDYDTIITGTSMTQSFSTELVDKCFDARSVRLTFDGEGFRRVNDNLKTAFECNDHIKLVIRSVDPIWYVTDRDFLEYGTYDAYPMYLYDDDVVNDLHYICNFEVIRDDLIPEIIRSARHEGPESFDDLIDRRKGDSDFVMQIHKRGDIEDKQIDPEETSDMMEALEGNVEANLLSTIKDNPETRFVLFIPPYSVFFWDDLLRKGTGVFERRIDMERYVVEQLVGYDNVELYSFMDWFDITSDLDNYIDDLHYSVDISERMIKCMSTAEEHRITSENYEDYLERIHDYYLNFDYDSLF